MTPNKENLIKRTIFSQIIEHLSEEEITVIIGPRQVGKTTLLGQIKDYLINQQKIKADLLFYFNLDLAKDLSLFQNQQDVIDFIKNRSNGQKIYFFIDEVQRIVNAGKFLKGLYDSKLNVKFIISGSSTLEIKAKIQEALTGRKKIFKLMPLSFSEFAGFLNPTILKIVKKQKKISAYDMSEFMKLVDEFAVFGGYPRVVRERNVDKKIELIEELYNSYLEKDIVNFLQIKNYLSFNKLVSLLAAYTGKLLNINQLAKNTGAEVKTINHYLDILEGTFIVKLIKPFFTNSKKELVKMPKVYFIDNGIRNFALSRFENFEERIDKGEVFENLAASELLKIIKLPNALHYWRSLQKAEVDFVIRKGDGELIPFEVKAEKMTKISISRSYRSFLNKYNPKTAFLVNNSLVGRQKIGKTNLMAVRISDIEDIGK